MKTEMEKMRNGELYRYDDDAVTAAIGRAQELCARLRSMTTASPDYRRTIKELLPSLPDTSTVTPPFHCDFGTEVTIGRDVFINYNCTMLDCGGITIGNHVRIGPSCNLYTPNHPLDALERRPPQETGLPIVIGDDTWLGGNVTVCPGVTIGRRCVIAAGAVVTRDIPDDSLAAGNPATVRRRLTT